MRKGLLFTVFVLLILTAVTFARPGDEVRTVYAGIAFYNQENLFDTIDNPLTRDEEFTPSGSYHWGTQQYFNKLQNMASVLSKLCTDRVKGGAAFVGLAEVENATVLEDLCNQPAMKERGFRYIFYQGEDRRGINVAALYNPKMFKPTHSELIPARGYKEWSGGYITRGVLHVEGSLLGERFHFMVNHWPSRGADSPSREFMGRLVRQLADSIQAVEPDARIVVMGDLNDDPDDKSITKALGAALSTKKVTSPTQFFNPWHEVLRKKGQGTLLYNGVWNLFDQILITANLLGEDRSTFKFFKSEIFRPAWMTTTEGRMKGAPKRTTSAGVWQNGFSDHFPTQLYLVKELK